MLHEHIEIFMIMKITGLSKQEIVELE